ALDPAAAAVAGIRAEEEIALARVLLGDVVEPGDLEELALERLARVEGARGGAVGERIDELAGQPGKAERERARHRAGGVLHLRGIEVSHHVVRSLRCRTGTEQLLLEPARRLLR